MSATHDVIQLLKERLWLYLTQRTTPVALLQQKRVTLLHCTTPEERKLQWLHQSLRRPTGCWSRASNMVVHRQTVWGTGMEDKASWLHTFFNIIVYRRCWGSKLFDFYSILYRFFCFNYLLGSFIFYCYLSVCLPLGLALGTHFHNTLYSVQSYLWVEDRTKTYIFLSFNVVQVVYHAEKALNRTTM